MKEMLHMYLEIEDTEVSEKIEAYLKAKRELIAALSNEGIKAKESTLESRIKTFEGLIEANGLEDDVKSFTAVGAAVNEGITRGIQDFVPKKSRSIRDNAQEQA